MLSSAGTLARGGVLVRRLQALEALSTVDTVVFDKTGTLTQDRMQISKITVREGEDAQYALRLAAAMAAHSLHPVSRALVLASHQPEIALDDEVVEVHGQGLLVHVAGQELRLGSARFCGFSRAATDVMQVFLADAHGWLASFDLEEAIRADAKEAIAALKAMHIKVEVLSGDRQLAVQRVAGQLDIDQVAADCSPQDKLAHMQALQGQGAQVAMVGDGLNDGPVLAAAHVSVAIGDAVPLAQAQADFVVLGGQLDQVVQLFKQARSTMRIVKQNLIWAAVYNALSVPLALMGWLPAWLAGLGMAISSLIVIMNAARLALPVKVK
jgi:Cu2+-exporting ATPase